MEALLELVETKQYTSLRQEMEEMNEADIASFLGELDESDMLKIFRILPKDLAADVFAYLELDEQQMIITSLSEKEATNIINNMMSDDAADLFDEMPSNVVKKLLAHADPEAHEAIMRLLKYPEDSAGTVMTVEYVDLKENLTVEQAIERIRKVGVDSETINICYVTDSKRTLIGTVALRYLLLSPPDAIIGDIMHENVISIHTHMDKEEVARQFQKYDFTVMPVVDNENRIVGIITVDDVIDIIQDEATEDIEKLTAITPSDKPYLKTNVLSLWKHRIPWLLILMISTTFTSAIILHFESKLGAYTVLTAFIPMLMGAGGNAGSQTSTTIACGLSKKELGLRNIFQVIWKEIRVAVMCGVVMAVVSFGKLLLIERVDVMVAFVVSLTLLFVICVAKIVGVIMPMLAKTIHLDPAVVATPFISTVLDALSLLIYFRVAAAFLNL